MQGAITYSSVRGHCARYLGWLSQQEGGAEAVFSQGLLLLLLDGPSLMDFCAYLLRERRSDPIARAAGADQRHAVHPRQFCGGGRLQGAGTRARQGRRSRVRALKAEAGKRPWFGGVVGMASIGGLGCWCLQGGGGVHGPAY